MVFLADLRSDPLGQFAYQRSLPEELLEFCWLLICFGFFSYCGIKMFF